MAPPWTGAARSLALVLRSIRRRRRAATSPSLISTRLTSCRGSTSRKEGVSQRRCGIAVVPTRWSSRPAARPKSMLGAVGSTSCRSTRSKSISPSPRGVADDSKNRGVVERAMSTIMPCRGRVSSSFGQSVRTHPSGRREAIASRWPNRSSTLHAPPMTLDSVALRPCSTRRSSASAAHPNVSGRSTKPHAGMRMSSSSFTRGGAKWGVDTWSRGNRSTGGSGGTRTGGNESGFLGFVVGRSHRIAAGGEGRVKFRAQSTSRRRASPSGYLQRIARHRSSAAVLADDGREMSAAGARRTQRSMKAVAAS
eukprot:scaffold176914_cov30-Tisochrysis_lutea.AAC.3